MKTTETYYTTFEHFESAVNGRVPYCIYESHEHLEHFEDEFATRFSVEVDTSSVTGVKGRLMCRDTNPTFKVIHLEVCRVFKEAFNPSDIQDETGLRELAQMILLRHNSGQTLRVGPYVSPQNNFNLVFYSILLRNETGECVTMHGEYVKIEYGIAISFDNNDATYRIFRRVSTKKNPEVSIVKNIYEDLDDPHLPLSESQQALMLMLTAMAKRL